MMSPTSIHSRLFYKNIKQTSNVSSQIAIDCRPFYTICMEGKGFVFIYGHVGIYPNEVRGVHSGQEYQHNRRIDLDRIQLSCQRTVPGSTPVWGLWVNPSLFQNHALSKAEHDLQMKGLIYELNSGYFGVLPVASTNLHKFQDIGTNTWTFSLFSTELRGWAFSWILRMSQHSCWRTEFSTNEKSWHYGVEPGANGQWDQLWAHVTTPHLWLHVRVLWQESFMPHRHYWNLNSPLPGFLYEDHQMELGLGGCIFLCVPSWLHERNQSKPDWLLHKSIHQSCVVLKDKPPMYFTHSAKIFTM